MACPRQRQGYTCTVIHIQAPFQQRGPDLAGQLSVRGNKHCCLFACFQRFPHKTSNDICFMMSVICLNQTKSCQGCGIHLWMITSNLPPLRSLFCRQKYLPHEGCACCDDRLATAGRPDRHHVWCDIQ